jgi:hypothetical protein
MHTTLAVANGDVIGGEPPALDADDQGGAAAAGHDLMRIVTGLETQGERALLIQVKKVHFTK